MTPKGPNSMRDSEGKGLLGCLASLVLLGVAIFLGIKLVPIYYSNFNFETDLKTEVSRVGSRFIENEIVIRDILQLAKKNEITLDKQDIRIERFAGQVHITVDYAVPVDFMVLVHTLKFQIKVSSFTPGG